jgi:hypothetical protein
MQCQLDCERTPASLHNGLRKRLIAYGYEAVQICQHSPLRRGVAAQWTTAPELAYSTCHALPVFDLGIGRATPVRMGSATDDRRRAGRHLHEGLSHE